MYFCPKCNYSFDVTKNLKNTDNRKKISDVKELFTMLENDDIDLSNYVANNFTLSNVKKDKRYNKLNDEIKQNINQIFESVASDINFNCNNCGYVDTIRKSIILYQINFEENNNDLKTLQDNMLLCKNPILPRTKDYECKNINCITHKNKENKEAIFYKDPHQYSVKYICCVCYNSWN